MNNIKLENFNELNYKTVYDYFSLKTIKINNEISLINMKMFQDDRGIDTYLQI